MNRSENRILVTHVGSLPRPEEIVEVYRARLRGEKAAEPDLAAAVTDVVRRQRESGVDIVTDGEYGKEAWWSYANDRLAGLEARESTTEERDRRTRDRMAFPGYYAYYEREASFALKDDWGRPKGPTRHYYCTGPISYVGHAQLQRDIENLKNAMPAAGVQEAFLPVVSPFTPRTWNEYYPSEDDFHQAMADALNEEYRAIVDAGLLVQIDDPGLPGQGNSQNAPTLAEYRKRAEQRVEVVNYALRGIPEDRIRYHICWGSGHGPHVHDLPLRDVADLLLKVRAQAYSIEAGNVRHEHEWKVWRDVKLPEGKVLIPGVVSHTTDTVEHPELVADRILRYAEVVGRENVIAGTDCGLGGRVHPEIAWAKLQALGEGAALASKELWGG